MNEHQIALAARATGQPLQWVIREYARDVTAKQRAEQEAHERRMQETYRQECDDLLAWVEQRLPGFGERLSFTFNPRNTTPPFQPIILIDVGSRSVRLIQDSRQIPGGNQVHLKCVNELTIAMPADQPDQNWANLVITIATITGELERAAVPAPGEVWGQ